MRIASWNVNGVRAAEKKGFIDWMLNGDWDAVFIQETKADEAQLTKALRQPDGYRSAFHSSTVKKGYSGVGLYYRDEPDEIYVGLGIDRFDGEGRALGARWGDLVVWGNYFPNGGQGPERVAYKLDFYAAMLERMNRQRDAGLHVAVCGDYNTAHMAIDLARPKENEKTSGFLPEERAWLDRYAEAGWVDSFRTLHPGEVRYSWWDQKTRARERNIGWRIDYFWIDPALLPRVVEADILDQEFGSDHAPVTLALQG
jgi:exodeoxyribonuclease-3